MATIDKKITELTEATILEDGDIFPIVDYPETVNKKMKWLTIKNTLQGYIASINNLFTIGQSIPSITLQTSGGTPADLNYYEEYSFSTTMSGIWSSPQNITIYIRRIGKIIFLAFPTITSISNASSFITITAPLPERFRPTTTIGVSGSVDIIDNSVFLLGNCNITDGGIITIYKQTSAGRDNFTSGGHAGVSSSAISFII